MFEVTKDNYHTFLSWHGMDPEVASIVVEQFDKSPSYEAMVSVRLWVEASKFVLRAGARQP